MAEVRKARPTASQAAAAGKGKGKAAAKQSPAGITGIRTELGKLRRDHRMQQLDSPAKLRDLRKALARELTKDRATQLQRSKESNG